jgi:hypothetical protein
MRKEAKKHLADKPLKPKKAGEIEMTMFNLKYCILDHGRVNTRV